MASEPVSQAQAVHGRSNPGLPVRITDPELDVHNGMGCVDQRHGFMVRGVSSAG